MRREAYRPPLSSRLSPDTCPEMSPRGGPHNGIADEPDEVGVTESQVKLVSHC